MPKYTIIIAGGGAAGFFSAIRCAELLPDAQVIVLEKTTKVLSKVKISGGGRCNVTNACFDLRTLIGQYPRGNKQLRSIFKIFSPQHTLNWFEQRGVALKTESDGRVFPVSDSSQTIIDCLLAEAKRLGVVVRTQTSLYDVKKQVEKGFLATCKSGNIIEEIACDYLVLAIGGHPQASHYQLAENLGHRIIPPIPSLFTFNVPDNPLSELPGVANEQSKVKITGLPYEQLAPVLVTHWGFSGPAILKLSAWAARELHDKNYCFNFQIHWLPNYNEDQIRELLQECRTQTPQRMVANHSIEGLPSRLWKNLCRQAAIEETVRWAELPKKNLNKLVDLLCRTSLQAEGKTTFKEEFVTAGGISADDIDWQTMQSLQCKGLFFAGELIDIDGVTGGFNFQAAWASGYVAASSIAAFCKQ